MSPKTTSYRMRHLTENPVREVSMISLSVKCRPIRDMILTSLTSAQIKKKCSYGNGRNYRESVSTTESGRTCQSWNSQTPYSHRFAGRYCEQSVIVMAIIHMFSWLLHMSLLLLCQNIPFVTFNIYRTVCGQLKFRALHFSPKLILP